MADRKIISATAKEPVINVNDGAKVAIAKIKEIVSNLSGFGEGWIPDPTLITFRQDKTIVNEYFSKSFRRSAKDIVGSVKTDIRIIAAKLIPDTFRTSDTFSRIVSYNRTLQETGYFLEDYTSFDYTMHGVNTTDVITAVRIAKVIIDPIDATDDFYGNANIDDDQTAQITKVINDYADPIEVFSRTVSYNRTFTESFSKSEVFGKILSLIKSDLIGPVEVFTKAGSKVINDAISKVEYKIAHMQDYFSGGYIAADYVGTTYTI